MGHWNDTLEWETGMEHWNGTLEWETGAELHVISEAVVYSLSCAKKPQNLIVFTDSIASARKVLNPAIHAGQEFSLQMHWKLRGWLEQDEDRSIMFAHVLSKLEWGIHAKVDAFLVELQLLSCGPRPYTSLVYLCYAATDSAQDV